MTHTQHPSQEPEVKKPIISPLKALAIVLAFQFFATLYCIHRVERSTDIAAKAILDSMHLNDSIQKVLDDTLPINREKIRDSSLSERSQYPSMVGDYQVMPAIVPNWRERNQSNPLSRDTPTAHPRYFLVGYRVDSKDGYHSDFGWRSFNTLDGFFNMAEFEKSVLSSLANKRSCYQGVIPTLIYEFPSKTDYETFRAGTPIVHPRKKQDACGQPYIIDGPPHFFIWSDTSEPKLQNIIIDTL